MKLVLPFIAVAFSLLTACGGSDSHPVAASAAPAVAVQTVTVKAAGWPDVYEATGTVRARTVATISARVMAYVQQVAVQAGDRVREGQVLVTLDSRDLDVAVRRAEAARAEVQSAMPEADNGIAAAKANLDLSRTTFKRMEELAVKKSISNQEFDEASTRLKAAEASYEMARARRAQLNSKLAQVEQEIRAAGIARDYARLASPFAGVVTARSSEPGSLAAPGAPLLTIEREGAYRLEVSVEESKVSLVKPGQAVEIGLEALDRRVPARVSEIVPAVDAASRAYTVKIDLPPMPNVRSGMFGRAWFHSGTRNVIALPSHAIVERGQLQSVFVLDDGFARARLITTGGRAEASLQVLSGLTEGERVIAPIPAGLADGSRVEVRQ